MQENEKDIQKLNNRFRELAEKSFQQNLFTFTGFLGLSEQDAFFRLERELSYAGCTLFGGRENAERRMLRFGSPQEFGYDVPFPIVCIHIRPVAAKFADSLSHRDFLGALMNLGIERSTLGDIMVGDKEAYLFCADSMGDYICEQLTQVRHTSVTCAITENFEEIPMEEPVRQRIQVSSPRVDALLAKVYNKSRSDCLELFRAGRVFVDGRLCESNSRLLKGGETVNARGFGKFVYTGQAGETRKGKLNVEVAVFR
ncbi:YlmH/Sll1252 family protein [Candidatus Acetatifactor stercoripullorum]|uniref:YlmH/Sll1252 family protein n=1 Tax=Candidatus Acetatifactor stercoripullorum TaxID=2838414 RepID=UPI00298E4AFF|nr:YlmH/Sll1252 family protein [Candidatus Acetatifactor stercoripullorum]